MLLPRSTAATWVGWGSLPGINLCNILEIESFIAVGFWALSLLDLRLQLIDALLLILNNSNKLGALILNGLHELLVESVDSFVELLLKNVNRFLGHMIWLFVGTLEILGILIKEFSHILIQALDPFLELFAHLPVSAFRFLLGNLHLRLKLIAFEILLLHLFLVLSLDLLQHLPVIFDLFLIVSLHLVQPVGVPHIRINLQLTFNLILDIINVAWVEFTLLFQALQHSFHAFNLLWMALGDWGFVLKFVDLIKDVFLNRWVASLNLGQFLFIHILSIYHGWQYLVLLLQVFLKLANVVLLVLKSLLVDVQLVLHRLDSYRCRGVHFGDYVLVVIEVHVLTRYLI